VLTANAEIDFDRSRYARLASFAPGVIREMKRDFGDTVLAGGIVAVIDSRELGEAKADLLSAVALVTLREQNHAREQELARKGISAEKDLLEAKTALTESRVAADRARQRLRNLGLADAAIERVVADRDTSSLLPLTATFGGTVVERNGAPGEIADTSLPLYTIADLDRMWALLDVSESEAVRLRPGLPVKFSSDGLAGRFFAGKITWVGAEVDRHTRMVRARAVLENAGGALRANMFGKAVVILGEGTESPAVPRDAVQWDGCCNIVFVAEGEARYRPRKVVLGANLGRFYEVLDGLEAGETVVTTGSFLLKTEILKDSIGAGCCEVNPGGE
jgi:cobalt-zinc-cadmium efflux system membrane fusion protein